MIREAPRPRERAPILPMDRPPSPGERATARIGIAIAILAALYFLGQLARAWAAGRLG